MDNQHLEQFRTAVGTWEDQRFVTQEELYAFAMFFLYLVNLGEAAGWVYDGHSLRVGLPMSTLTVKATIDGVPYVVFTSGRDPASCVRMFIRKIEADLLEWRPDQYRT